VARSHIKLWRGDLVISKGTSRRREEQDGEVSAFMIGDTCFAWWSKEQLTRLAERKQQDREAQEAEWSTMKGQSGVRLSQDITFTIRAADKTLSHSASCCTSLDTVYSSDGIVDLWIGRVDLRK
jgi:hypothetical protein